MIKQKKLVPKRRFEGYTNNWEKQNLDNVLDLLKDGTHGTHKNVKDGIYLLSAKNIKNGKINFDKSDRIISIDEYRAIHRNFELKKGDVLLTVVGSIGESAILNQENIFTFQRSVAYLRPKELITSQYLFTTINSINFQNELKDRQVVSAQPGIYLGDLSVIPIYFPSLKEQQQIGQFFKHLDEMITLEQRKIDKTKALKSAYLAEMFPAEGERVPKRRFKGFTGEWEKHDLGELTKINTGESDAQDSTVDGKYPFFVRSENIQRSDRYTFDGEAILIPGEGRLGDIYHYFVGKFDYHQRVYKISDFAGELDGKFTLYTMHKTFKKHALKNTVKATVDSLRLPVITEYELLLPTKKEQIKIASLFTNLDNIITTHEKKLAKLKATKQAYLHEMFV